MTTAAATWFPVVVTLGSHVEVLAVRATDDADALAKARAQTSVTPYMVGQATFAVGESTDTRPDAGRSQPECRARQILYTGFADAHGLYDHHADADA